jgi:hypothetical protein
MKKNLPILILFVFAVGLLCSCKKKLETLASISTTENLSFLKIIDAAPSFRQVLNGRDSFNVYVNGVKVNGSFLTYGSSFPTTSNLYVGVPAGPQSIRITVNGVLTPDSITLGSFNKTLESGAYYSFIITDSVLKGNDAKQMFIRDNFTLTDTSHFTLRFINAVLNDPGSVDVYSYRNAANIFSNIPAATVTPFMIFPYTLLSDTLSIRTAGTTTEIVRINGAVFTRSRAYTLLYRGLLGSATKPRTYTLYGNE